ncbi:MAG: c-type cytochrome [Verrucomicrobia bacterium]|nr:c-type cytochrome [Verrucomicrobiota bacterium]MBV9644112.1 c-type cytochrome [Verrucomicrobiota bacterium]
MQARTLYSILLFGGLGFLCGCDRLPGKPKEEDRWKPPSEIKDFALLFNTNCRGCHSNGQTLSASISMNNPPYLAVVPKEVMHKTIETGIPGTQMPTYSDKAGGSLTEEQVNILVEGIYNWAKGHEAPTDNLPPYSAALGDAERGKAVFAQACASCHGSGGEGTKGKGGAVDKAYLSLVSDQYLRTVVIVGRPELGMPGFREYVPGKPMTGEEISDVVSWLASRREGPAPGQSAKTAEIAPKTQPSTPNE